MRTMVIILMWAGLTGLAFGQSSQAVDPASGPTAKPSLSANDRPVPPRDTSSLGENSWAWGRMVLAMALVVGLIFLLRWILSRASRVTTDVADAPTVEVVARRALSAKHAVYVVRFGGQMLLLGAGPTGVTKLAMEEFDGIEGVENAASDDAEGGVA